MTETTEEPVEFFEDEKPDQVYIKPRLDMKLSDKHKAECRDIAQEIKKFGINQRQLLFLIDILAMEVENNETMRAIRKATESGRDKAPEDSGLILPQR